MGCDKLAEDKKCPECYSRNLHRDEIRGEIVCEHCGLVLEDNLAESTQSLGSYEEEGAPDTLSQSVGLDLDFTKNEGDREWTLPEARKRKQRAKKKGVIEKLAKLQDRVDAIDARRREIEIEQKELRASSEDCEDRIHELNGEDLSLSKELRSIKDNVSTVQLGREDKLAEWSLTSQGHAAFEEDENLREMMDYSAAKELLGLGPGENEVNIPNQIKELKPEVNWFDNGVIGIPKQREKGIVVGFIEKPGIPERSPIDENGEKVHIPAKERRGIEVYAHLTGDEIGFWFFVDYIRRLKLNDLLIEKILLGGLPVSSRLSTRLRSINNRGSELRGNGAGFIGRCNRLIGTSKLPSTMPHWLENPPAELWNRLALGRGSSEDSYLHRWVMRDYSGEGEMKGLVRRYSDPLILRHIPIAYYVAQECWCMRIPKWKEICVELLQKIAEDLEWCAATVEEMDAWWDSVWSEQDDDTPSVTKLRHS